MSVQIDNEQMTSSHLMFTLRLKDNQLKSFNKPGVMGVINMSPNSFYDPKSDVSNALFLIEQMVDAGADIIDIGGEATNPFVDIETDSPTVQKEIDRILPLLEKVRQHFDVLISVDTSQPKVMQQAIASGADMINDQRALRVGNAVEVVSKANVPVCLMHFFNPIRTPGCCEPPVLLNQIKMDLQQSIDRCIANGIKADQIIIDPGFGQGNYGKNCAENFYLLSRLPEFVRMGYPVLVGWSRKSMIGDVLGGADPDKRLFGSIASASIAAYLGASIIRVHDVKETVDAIKVVMAINQFAQQK